MRRTRDKNRLDYKHFHKTGEKVFENRNNFITSVTIEVELKIVCKINRFLEENELSLFSDIEEIDGSLEKMRSLLEEYEDVHIELKRELGDDEYEKTYTEHQKTRGVMMTWLKDAKLEIRNLKLKSSERVLEKLRVEEKFLFRNISRELDNIENEVPSLVEDFEQQMSIAEKFILDYSEMFCRIEEQGSAFSEEFGDKYEKTCAILNKIVTSRRTIIQNMKVSFKDDEEQRLKQQALEKSVKEEKQNILFCQNIHTNICDRFSSLETKMKIQMSDLTDAQVLRKREEMKFLEKEFHEILDKILKLSQLNPSRYDESRDFLTGVNQRKHNLQLALDTLRGKIDHEILDRDISEEKIKNSSLLGIDLPKFEGYKSKLDFYSFKSKFIKLFSPKVKSCLLPDYLKSNYLTGQAFQLVREIDNLDAIWERLEECFGDVPTLLNMKLEEVTKCTPLTKLKGEDKINDSLVKIRNLMKELSTLAADHGIDYSLYHSSNLGKIFALLGKKRQVDITKSLLDLNAGEKETWEHIIDSLNKEIRINEKISLFNQAIPSSTGSENDKDKKPRCLTVSSADLTCHICGKSDHVPTITRLGKKVINYHSCEKFVNMNPKERFDELAKKKLCAQCLTPGRKFGHKGRCFDKYACPDSSHRSHSSGLHILVCDKHKDKAENSQLLETYKTKCIENFNQPEFSKSIKIAFHVQTSFYEAHPSLDDECDKDVAIYMLQTIEICGQKFNLFYDNGCTDMVVTKAAADVLAKLGKARNVSRKKVSLTGIGDLQTVGHYGKFEIILPLHNGNEVKISGSCLDKITSCFPTFSLDKAGQEFDRVSAENGHTPGTLPRLPKSVGGDTDIMIGIQYYKYWPDEAYKLSNGLRLYESQFVSFDGTRGVVGGPHASFNDLYDASAHHVYFSDEVRLFVQGFRQGLHTGIRDVTVSEIEFTTGDFP